MGFGRGRVAYHTEHGIELYGIDAREWGGGRWKYGVRVAWHKKNGSPAYSRHICKGAMVTYNLIWDEREGKVRAKNARIVLDEHDEDNEDDGWSRWYEDKQDHEHHGHQHGHQHHQGSEDQEARPHKRRQRMFMGADDEDARIVI